MVDQYNRWYPDFPGQQPYQDPAYMRAFGQAQVAPQSAPQRQTLTPPTIRAEIVQLEDMASLDRYPMAAGTSQMFMTRDEKHIVIRSTLANGQHTDDIYDRRPPQTPAPAINPADYVRKDELSALIAQSMQAAPAAQTSAKEATV